MPPPYTVAYVDPCWAYRNLRTGGSHKSGSAQKYATMPVEEIASLPVSSIMARDSLLALWATTPLGADPFTVMAKWGFTYKTKLYWHKVGRKGLGYWLRGEVEELLIGIRGKVPAWRHNAPNWVGISDDRAAILATDPLTGEVMEVTGLASKPEGHSRKPASVRELLTKLTPGASRVELFATETAEGWDSYGLDLGHDFRVPAFWTDLQSERWAAQHTADLIAKGARP